MTRISERRARQLESFIRMHARAAKASIDSYLAGGEPTVCLADVRDDEWGKDVEICPVGLCIKRYTLERLNEKLDMTSLTVQVLLEQFVHCDHKKQAVVGLCFGSDDVIAHTIQIYAHRDKH